MVVIAEKLVSCRAFIDILPPFSISLFWYVMLANLSPRFFFPSFVYGRNQDRMVI